MSRLGLFLLAFALATGLFWLTILTDPPKSEAAVKPQLAYAPVLMGAPLARREKFIPEELCGRFAACPD